MERSARRKSAPPAVGRISVARTALAVAGVVAFIAVALVREAPDERRPAPGAGDAAMRTASDVGPEVAADPRAAADRFSSYPEHQLQHHVLAMAAPERNGLFRLVLADRALSCDDVTDSRPLTDGLPAWRVSCGGAEAYIVEIDRLGRFVIDRQIYHEGLGPRPPGSAPGEIPAGETSETDRLRQAPFDRFR